MIHLLYFLRTTFTDSQFKGEIQLLKPVNMDLSIKRNLSASWYHSIPDIQINAHLKPMSVSIHILYLCLVIDEGHIAANINFRLIQLILSQEDLTVVLKTLSENLSETSDAPPAPSSTDKGDTVSTKDSQSSGGMKRTQIEIVKLYQLLMHMLCQACVLCTFCVSDFSCNGYPAV